jgi:hypothetical protein
MIPKMVLVSPLFLKKSKTDPIITQRHKKLELTIFKKSENCPILVEA